MRLSHATAKTRVSFDDPHLVSHAGLVPVMALAERAGLQDLVAEHVRPGGDCGANPGLKVACLVAGMAAGADSIDDMGVLRHGALSALFGLIRAPSTLGSHVRMRTLALIPLPCSPGPGRAGAAHGQSAWLRAWHRIIRLSAAPSLTPSHSRRHALPSSFLAVLT